MGFLAPWFLAGLAAVGLPIWVHLLRQHKSPPLPFSSLMFFEKRVQSSMKHRRLKHLLLLAARLALFALIVLAFAQPFLMRPAGAGGGRRLTLIAIDDSFSMRQGDRMARAKSGAQGVLTSLPANEQAQVMAIGAQARMLSQQVNDKAQLRAAIDGVEAGDSRSSYGEFARVVRSIAESAKQPVSVHLFTDVQRTALPPGFSDLRLSPNVSLKVHALADKATPNYTVESVNAPRGIFDPKKVRIQATVAGFSTSAGERRVSLAMNGKEVASKTVNIPANGRASVEFTGLEATYGLNRGEVRIDGGDTFAADDRFLFAAERTDPRKVLFVHEARQARGVLYMKAAMEASAGGEFVLEPVTTEQVANIAPSRYSFVILSDVASLPQTFETELNKFVRGGGSVWVALGPSAAARPRVPVFDAPVSESRYAARGAERFQIAASLDATHPSIHASNKWEGVKFYQAIGIEPGDARIIARLSDQTPLLMEKKVGEGKALVFASTFDNISNDFPLHSSFVPFVEQTAHYLGTIESRPSSLPVGSYLELRVEKGEGAAVEVLDPAGGRALSLREASTAQAVPLQRVGFWEVRRANGRHELAAVNADRKESDLAPAPADTIALWQKTGGAEDAATGTAAGEQAQPRSYWWYVLLAGMLAALFEALLASRYLGMEEEAA